jgi:DNA-binding CsgD family transcriptional regulator/N-acetylneuraminic acid mutarotase
MTSVDTNGLSERELEILKLVATGASNKEIARKLFISLNTVKVHLRNIFTKIGVNTRTEAAMYAVKIGLVSTISPQTITEASTISDNETLFKSPMLSRIMGERKRFYIILGTSSILILIFIIISLFYSRGDSGLPDSNATQTSDNRWQVLPGLLIPKHGMAVTSFESYIYAIGGESIDGISADIESYDPKINHWVSLFPKPTAVTDIQAAIVGGLIYIPGGKLASGKPTDIVEIYDPSINKWSSGKNMPEALSGYALAVFEGRMYLFGGWNGTNIVNASYVFDPNDNTWTEESPMPTARSFAGAAVVDRKIYVIGGWDGKQALATTEVYQPDSTDIKSQWSDGISMPSGRYAMGVSCIADIIFLAGGTSAKDDLSLIALSQEDSNWRQVESPLQNGETFFSVATIGTMMYILGGDTEKGLSTKMWSYKVIYIITLPIIR